MIDGVLSRGVFSVARHDLDGVSLAQNSCALISMNLHKHTHPRSTCGANLSTIQRCWFYPSTLRYTLLIAKTFRYMIMSS